MAELYDFNLHDQLHECSHAVVAWELGMPGPSEIRFRPYRPATLQIDLELYPIELQIMTYMAGPAADDFFFPRIGVRRIYTQSGNQRGEDDFKAINRLMMNFPFKEHADKKSELLERTVQILARRKEAIIKLAKSMVGLKRVRGTRAKKTFLAILRT